MKQICRTKFGIDQDNEYMRNLKVDRNLILSPEEILRATPNDLVDS